MFEGNAGVERSAVVREAVRLSIEEALQAEVAEELGRGYFERGAEPGGRGHRNGDRLGKLGTAEGRIEYAVPPSKVGAPRCERRWAARAKSWNG